MYFHSFLITEMVDGKNKTRKLAETTTHSKQSLANEKNVSQLKRICILMCDPQAG